MDNWIVGLNERLDFKLFYFKACSLFSEVFLMNQKGEICFYSGAGSGNLSSNPDVGETIYNIFLLFQVLLLWSKYVAYCMFLITNQGSFIHCCFSIKYWETGDTYWDLLIQNPLISLKWPLNSNNGFYKNGNWVSKLFSKMMQREKWVIGQEFSVPFLNFELCLEAAHN